MVNPDPHPENTELTVLLNRLASGDPSAAEQLLDKLYLPMRRTAEALLYHEHPGAHKIEPTALVHEAFMKLIAQDRVDWKNRSHFLALGAQAMRRALVDLARSEKRQKRGGDLGRVTFDEQIKIEVEPDTNLLALDEALQQLAELDPRGAKVVEMRFFGGLTVPEVAEALGVSARTVEGDWATARAWLKHKLSEDL